MANPPELANLIGGMEIRREVFHGRSPFYPDYEVATPQIGELDAARAIGAARRAERGSFADRWQALQRAAEAFHLPDEIIDHTVRVTGIPRRVVLELAADIPRWLKGVPEHYAGRLLDAGSIDLPPGAAAEVSPHVRYQPLDGPAYVLCPATDPRAPALAAANLVALGIPFILKASRHDALAPRVLDALIAGGLDPHFCSLLYFDNHTSSGPALHARLIEASPVVWTFGPRAGVYRAFGLPSPASPGRLPGTLAGKTTLFHEDAACAAIVSGGFSDRTQAFLEQSLAFASGCTAVRGVFLLEAAEDWPARCREWLARLRVGDPLDLDTQVGYFHPANLHALERARQVHRAALESHGGQRLSPQQQTPLLLELARPVSELLGQEIPACFLATFRCGTLAEAVDTINQTAVQPPRLTVATHNLELNERNVRQLARVQARNLHLEQPTSAVHPHFHEGNDYLRLLSRPRLFAGKAARKGK